MTQWPKISIVTPSYNQGPYIGWTARSVLLQRYPNLEYMVLDGGSKDDTMKVLEPYRSRLAYLVSEKDKGQADAIHRGFARSTGEIMAYLNSDDMLAPGALLYVARFFQEHPEVDAIYSHRLTVNGANRVIWHWILPQHRSWYMTRWDLIPQETCFWRRSIFEKVGNIDPSYHFAMDYDLFVRIMQAGTMARVNRFLGAFRAHDDSKTTKDLKTVGYEEVQRVWKKYNVAAGRFDKFRGDRFCQSVNRRGRRFGLSTKRLPGALAGIGYDYDDVWGGLLNDDRLPPLAGEVGIAFSALGQ